MSLAGVGVGVAECANCGEALAGPYCAACGQKVARLDPTLGEFLHELVHEIAHVDGKFAASIRLLLTRPGFLSREQFAGRRARYVSPIRLYLTFSVLYFAVASFAPAHFVKITKLNALPGETAEAFEVRRHTLEETSNEIVMHWVPRAMFVDVPIFAALVALAARRSGRNYPQHLYFSLHVHGAWFLMATLPTAVGIAAPRAGKSIGSVVMLWGLVYFVMAFRRAYGATVVRSTVSAVAVGVAYFVVVLISLMAIAFPYAYRAGILGK